MIRQLATTDRQGSYQVTDEQNDLGTGSTINPASLGAPFGPSLVGYSDVLARYQAFEKGDRITAEDTGRVWIVSLDASNSKVLILLSQGSANIGFGFGLPPPRVRIFNGRGNGSSVFGALTRSGVPINAPGQVIVSLEDVPSALLTNPQYRFQLELLRYMPKRSRSVANGMGGHDRRSQPQGFYHPSNWIGGTNPTPQVAGTRFGAQNFPGSATVQRQTEWPLSGLAEMARVTITVAEAFIPWYDVATINDKAGSSALALLYWLGKKRPGTGGIWSYTRNPFLGVFKFRFAAYDIVAQRFVVGPHSEPIYTRPRKWPTIPVYGTYPITREINPNNQADFLVLTAGMGGRVNGRV